MLLNDSSFMQILYEMINEARDIEGGFTRLLALLICLIVIFIINRKDIGKVCIPVALNLILLFTPYLYVSLYQDTSYKRFFWSLPEGILFAYTIILVVSKLPKLTSKGFLALLMSIVVIYSGTNIYLAESGFYKKAENLQQVDQSLIDLSDKILSIDSEPTCIFPYQALEMIRVANPGIIQIAGRNCFGYMGQADTLVAKLIQNVSSPIPDSDFVFSMANSRGVKFVVTMNYSQIDEHISSGYGYVDYGVFGDYHIYYNSNPIIRENEWYITQYGPDWGKNCFYTIEDTQGNLIIIDGGHYGNSGHLERIIRDHNYHVSAWIFTSLYDDHVGAAYNVLREDGELFTVDTIYFQCYTEEMLDAVFFHQDTWEISYLDIANDFVHLLGQMNNVTYVDEGRDYDIMGLNMHIFHIWDNDVVEIGNLEASNSSMIFSINGNENSMLFLSDTTPSLENSVFESIGNNRFEYITANDHGNMVYNYQWYDDRKPIGIFIDEYSAAVAPGGQAFGFYSYCIERGYNVYTFETVPNRIVIR